MHFFCPPSVLLLAVAIAALQHTFAFSPIPCGAWPRVSRILPGKLHSTAKHGALQPPGARSRFGRIRLSSTEEETEVQRLNRMLQERQEAIRKEQEEEIEKRMIAKHGAPASIVAATAAHRGDEDDLWYKLPKNILQRYRFGRMLGQGSFGCVILAHDKVRGNSVAVKLVDARAGEQPIVIREGIVMSLIDSPYIPRCLDYGVDGNLCWFIQDYIEGPDMNWVLEKQGRLSVREATLIALEVLEALNSVHAAGFVHRDIKPHNILRVTRGARTTTLFRTDKSSLSTYEYTYRLVDFGTATGADGSEDEDGNTDLDCCVLRTMGEDTQKKLWAVFRAVDQDKSGFLEVTDLARCFKAVGIRPVQSQLDNLVHKYSGHTSGGERDGKISFDAFMIMFGELVAAQDRACTQGTHGYIAPEQYLGQHISAATDIYSLGAMLYKLTTGRLPFEPKMDEPPPMFTAPMKIEWEKERWMKVAADPASPPAVDIREIDHEIPQAFAQTVMKCLARDPESRFEDAKEAQRAFEKVLRQMDRSNRDSEVLEEIAEEEEANEILQ